MPRSRLRRLRLLLGAAVIVGVAAGGYQLSRLAPVGTAYAAKTLCSGVFVSGRAAADVESEDLRADNHPLLALVDVAVDRERRRTAATFAGFARRVAQYRPDAGCTLALGTTPDALLTQRSDVSAARDAGALPHAALTAKSEADAVTAALDWAFSEPDPQRLRRTRAVVILREGKIVAERYATGFSAQTPLPGWSMAKTVTAALAGITVGEGKLALDSSALLPQWRSDGRAQITLAHLLRMTDGLAFSERYDDPFSDVVRMLFVAPDIARFVTAKPLRDAPGSVWRYSSGTTNVLMAVLRFAHGGDNAALARWLQDALLDRIGMHSAVFETDPAGMPVASSFLYASAQDWARFGQFLLQDGVWNGERTLPPGWVRYMTTVTPLAPRGDFGAHLWVRVPEPFNSADGTPPGLPADAFHAAGHEGQFVSVVPSRRLVVVRLGLSRQRGAWDHEAFLERVLRAFPG